MDSESITRLIRPRELELLDLIEHGGEEVVRAAELLDDLLHRHPDGGSISRELVRSQEASRGLTREVVDRLHRTFVTPIEREDIHAIALAQRDIVDLCERAGDMLTIYRLGAVPGYVQPLGGLVLDGSRLLADALPRMREFRSVDLQARGMARVARDGSRRSREALATMLDNQSDALVVLGWRDVVAALRDAVSRAADAMEVVRAVVVRHR